ncbi:MAG: hypothetical protein JW995_00850 [Melioribacteraceae bacterium]|nr:hypothetical protein [Melioribacteraceae bacterium]
MRKNAFLSELTISLMIFIGSLFVYLFSLNEIKRFNKEIDTLQSLLREKINQKELYTVEVQRLMSEDRIVKIASDSLGLVRSGTIYKSIFVDEAQLARVNEIVNRRYE